VEVGTHFVDIAGRFLGRGDPEFVQGAGSVPERCFAQ